MLFHMRFDVMWAPVFGGAIVYQLLLRVGRLRGGATAIVSHLRKRGKEEGES